MADQTAVAKMPPAAPAAFDPNNGAVYNGLTYTFNTPQSQAAASLSQQNSEAGGGNSSNFNQAPTYISDPTALASIGYKGPSIQQSDYTQGDSLDGVQYVNALNQLQNYLNTNGYAAGSAYDSKGNKLNQYFDKNGKPVGTPESVQGDSMLNMLSPVLMAVGAGAIGLGGAAGAAADGGGALGSAAADVAPAAGGLTEGLTNAGLASDLAGSVPAVAVSGGDAAAVGDAAAGVGAGGAATGGGGEAAITAPVADVAPTEPLTSGYDQTYLANSLANDTPASFSPPVPNVPKKMPGGSGGAGGGVSGKRALMQSNVHFEQPDLARLYQPSSKTLKTPSVVHMPQIMAAGASGADPVSQNGIHISAIQALTKRIAAAKATLANLQGAK